MQSVKQKIKLNLLLIYPNKPNLTAHIYKLNKVFSKPGFNIIARKVIKKNILNKFWLDTFKLNFVLRNLKIVTALDDPPPSPAPVGMRL